MLQSGGITKRDSFSRHPFLIFAGLFALACAVAPGPRAADPVVVIKTSLGEIRLQLHAKKAPATVRNFLRYVDARFYDGTLFHRVIPGFMIQGGGFTRGMRPKETRAPIANEAGNGLKNRRGTAAMARTQAVDSATSQFFINLVDNVHLDHRDDTPAGFGYCVFGRVIGGMAVVDAIGRVPTRSVGYFRDVPARDVVIVSVRRAG